MKNENVLAFTNVLQLNQQKYGSGPSFFTPHTASAVPEILFISSFPPRQCGIATYSQDLIKSIENKFGYSFKINICPLESESEKHVYPDDIKYVLNTDSSDDFKRLAEIINSTEAIKMVLIQHEFGLFKKQNYFKLFLKLLRKPVVLAFHTVLPNPNEELRSLVQTINIWCQSIIVMTNNSSKILIDDYGICGDKITVIPHGTHLVSNVDKTDLKTKYKVEGRKILTTFGLLSSGKSIETTLNAMPAIIKTNPEALFLIIGKTHPNVIHQEGEKYRTFLEEKVTTLNLQQHVKFVNSYVSLPDLLEYLQMTDVYLFTSKDPNQAVSGTFAYAMSCGCPIVSTPIPHCIEVLSNESGIIIDFENANQLADAVEKLFNDSKLRKSIRVNSLHNMAPTAWENSAIAHALLIEEIIGEDIFLQYVTPDINLNHIKKLSTDFGMIQFSVINEPDIGSGYTLDDNARALVALCDHFELSKDPSDLALIETYLNFILFCLQSDGKFLNYVDESKKFTSQNYETNLEDSNGRAIWALGFLISKGAILPKKLLLEAETIIQIALTQVDKIYSTRAMAFIIKGLYYRNTRHKYAQNQELIHEFAKRMVKMYVHESDENWSWYESYLTYGNSSLPEAMLCAYLATGDQTYLSIAKKSFDFLLSKIFTESRIKVISNKGWSHKGENFAENIIGGEQPIDVAYTILALSKFYNVFKEEAYLDKITLAFSWFLGNNHLHQIIYNPCTGGCYDGLEETYVNLNQGAESTVSYNMARLVVERLSLNSGQNIPTIALNSPDSKSTQLPLCGNLVRISKRNVTHYRVDF